MAEALSVVSRNRMVMSGMYCLRGTRITVRMIKGRHRGGDSAEYIAKDYGLPKNLILKVLRWGR